VGIRGNGKRTLTPANGMYISGNEDAASDETMDEVELCNYDQHPERHISA